MMALMAWAVNPAQIKAKLMPTRIQMMAGLMAVIPLMACLMAAKNLLAMRHLPTLPTLPTDMETSQQSQVHQSRRSEYTASPNRACPKSGRGELFWPMTIRSTAIARCAFDTPTPQQQAKLMKGA